MRTKPGLYEFREVLIHLQSEEDMVQTIPAEINLGSIVLRTGNILSVH